jgi:hypothetical protein
LHKFPTKIPFKFCGFQMVLKCGLHLFLNISRAISRSNHREVRFS